MPMANIIKPLQYQELGKAVGWVKHTGHICCFGRLSLSLSLEIIHGQKYYFVSFVDYVIGLSPMPMLDFLMH